MGFLLILAIFIGFGVYSIVRMEKLASIGMDGYAHPMIVGQAVREANIAILKMHRAMLMIPGSQNDEQLRALESIVNENQQAVEARLQIVRERFLGDPSDVDKTRQAFEAWAPIRATVIRLRHEGKVADAEHTTQVLGMAQVAEIEKQLAVVTEFATAKAEEFLKGAIETRDHTRRVTLLLLGISLLIAFTIAGVTTRSIVRPVLALSAAAEKVADGEFTGRVEFDSRGELGTLARVFNLMVRSIRLQTETIKSKNEENERLLLNILPKPIAGRLRSGEHTIADAHADVTVLFADIVGFTQYSSTVPVKELVGMLNEVFSAFDQVAAREGVEKIKTIGDAYMAVTGMPVQRKDHTEAMVRLALGIMKETAAFNLRHGTALALRIGINRGPVIAGVIGKHKFIYDLWGDTVNIASRMESTGVPGRIQLSEAAYRELEGLYEFEARGEISVKGKGMMEAYLLKTKTAVTTS